MHTADRERVRRWIRCGMYEGAKWGSLLGTLYLVGVIVLWFIASFPYLYDSAVYIFFTFLSGLMVGVFPAMVLGSLIGGVVAGMVATPTVWQSLWLRQVVGLITGSLLVLGLQSFCLFTGVGADKWTYWLFLGFPSLVCLMMVYWLSSQLPILTAEMDLDPTQPVPNS